MNPLSILLQASQLTKGAERMLETDPHGWTLSLIAVTVVFSALAILFVAFSLVGKMSMKLDANSSESGAAKKIKKGKGMEPEVAAAIAMALETEKGDEVPVVISAALAIYLDNGGVHDAEPFAITINHNPGAWDNPVLNFRKNPVK